MTRFSRRKALFGAALLAAGGFVAPASAYTSSWPAKPAVPTDFNAEELFCELGKNGRGVTWKGPKDADDLIVVHMVFDPQCSWCLWQMNQYAPFRDRVRFVWHPVAVLSRWSAPQGAAILSSKDPEATLAEHEAHFRDAAFRGLDVRKMQLPDEAIDAVWTNSKIYRRAGGRDVPFGVARLPDGRYVSLPEEKGEAFAEALGLKL